MKLMLGYWVHDIDPYFLKFPDGFPLDGIKWYGVMYLIGFIIAGFLFYLYGKRGKIDWDIDMEMTFLSVMVVGVMVGGRGGYMLLYDFGHFLREPMSFFNIRGGGMSSHGAMVGILGSMYWFSRKYGKSYWLCGDMVVSVAGAGIFLGRLGNFINGELWGKVTGGWWGVVFPGSEGPWVPVSMVMARHPSQLYEAILEGLIIFLYMQYRVWTRGLGGGRLMGEFCIGYGIVRIIVEFYRESDASLILGMSRGQFYSLFLILLGFIILTIRKEEVKG